MNHRLRQRYTSSGNEFRTANCDNANCKEIVDCLQLTLQFCKTVYAMSTSSTITNIGKNHLTTVKRGHGRGMGCSPPQPLFLSRNLHCLNGWTQS